MTHTQPTPACAADPAAGVPAPSPGILARLLNRYAPLAPAPLCPEVKAFYGRSLVDLWAAAEQLVGRDLPAPFWGYPWPAGCALGRVLLDEPALVRGRRVLDIGCGGGVGALAAARAGAGHVAANDIDPWAVATAQLAAARQGLIVRPLVADLTSAPQLAFGYDVVLCGDLAYERSQASPQRELLERARNAGSRVLVADAERTYFASDGLRLIAEYRVAVPRDLEGVDTRTARVYELE